MASRGPTSVTVNDDDPQAGYCTLFLDTPGLKVKKALIGPSKPENAEVAVELKDKSISVSVSIQGGEQYHYKKGLPEDIDSSRSSHKVKRDGVVLKLAKRERVSWSAHVRYLMSRE